MILSRVFICFIMSNIGMLLVSVVIMSVVAMLFIFSILSTFISGFLN